MHTLLVFLAWPDGAVWGNVGAMPVCGLIAGFFAFVFRDHIGRALKDWAKRHFGHHAELDEIRSRLDAHADALDSGTPGGLGAVMAELRDVKAAVEAQAAGIGTLASIARRTDPAPHAAGEAPPPMPAGGPGTPGRKTRAPGMGARVAPKQGGATEMRKTADGKAESS